MNDKTEKELNNAINAVLRKVRDSGLRTGTKVICKIVLDMANDDKKTEHEKLSNIINFCKRSLDVSEPNKGE